MHSQITETMKDLTDEVDRSLLLLKAFVFKMTKANGDLFSKWIHTFDKPGQSGY